MEFAGEKREARREEFEDDLSLGPDGRMHHRRAESSILSKIQNAEVSLEKQILQLPSFRVLY